MALATLGMFVFEIDTLPFLSLDRQSDWRYGDAERFGARKASQFLGPGGDKITLTGALYGGQIGDYGSLDTIREMAEAGEAYPLLDGLGNVLGNWKIISLKATQSLFYIDGVPRKADFSLDLDRADDDAPAQEETANG